jgi:RNA polymerase sigma-70 factor (ECF subfamily)
LRPAGVPSVSVPNTAVRATVTQALSPRRTVTRKIDRRDHTVVQDDADLYRKHAEELTRLATGLVGPDAAADVVSAAVLGCLAHRGWRQVENRRAYLFRSVVNESAKFHRANARRWSRERRVADASAVDPPEVRPEVLAAVGRLSYRQRAVIVLTYWADLDPVRIGDLLGITEGSVRRHLARARARLKEVLDDHR